MLGTIQGAMVRLEPVASIVWPSGSARTTAVPAIVPPAPPRFSMTIGWPSSIASGSNTARGTRSVALPAAKGMKARNGLVGHDCAAAIAVEAMPVARVANAIHILNVVTSPAAHSSRRGGLRQGLKHKVVPDGVKPRVHLIAVGRRCGRIVDKLHDQRRFHAVHHI